MKPIITDASALEIFIENGAIYVDKTEQLYNLITNPSSRNYFIARPRRFGKSLMISTLEAIFKGRRELFEGTAIASKTYDWQVYPVLRFDFSKARSSTYEQFVTNFACAVRDGIVNAGATYHPDESPSANFNDAINELYRKHGKRVVLLIDEYDAPVGYCLGDVGTAEKIRDDMSSFYIQIKANNGIVRFMMMTGVSKFTQLSVFSALSNLTDLTIRKETADLLGYSGSDLEKYFMEHMREHADIMGISYEAYRKKLAKWSDGYRFSIDSDVHMYNPFAIANTLVMKLPTFRSNWASTGRPSFLMKYFNREELLEQDWENVEDVTSKIFDAADLRALEPATILYQAGYLTIKNSDESGESFSLGIPNQEVRKDFNAMLFEIQTEGKCSLLHDQIGSALMRNEFDKFETRVKAFYAKLPYGAREEETRKHEFPYARIFNALLQGYGFELRPEDTQSCGRADLVAKGKKGTYVFEFKVNESAAKAIDQIKAKDYAAPFRDRGLPIFAIGINFDSKTARVSDFAVEEI